MTKPRSRSTLLRCLIIFSLLVLAGCDSASPTSTPATISLSPTPTPGSGLPDDIPLYPGAHLVGTPAPGQASFQMPGSPQAISSFYQSQMPQHGWKTDQVQDNGADGILLAFSKDGHIAHFVIAPGAEAQQSSVLITIGTT